MFESKPKIRHVKNKRQEDPWAKLRERPGVTIHNEAVIEP